MTNRQWPTSVPPWIMGILNVTPDSFSDGGKFLEPDDSLAHVNKMIAEGVDIVDIGGESTRPGSLPVAESEQIRRIVPIIAAVRRIWDGPISIDTTRSIVAREALDAGGTWINDISALRDDPAMVGLVVDAGCPVVLMHMLGSPRTMQDNPEYGDVVAEVSQFLVERVKFAASSGVKKESIILDPGIGFGKTVEHNMELLSRMPEVVALGYPVLVGASRKSFIGRVSGDDVGSRLAGSVTAAVKAVESGATIVRVHDVGPTRQALRVAKAIARQ